MINSPSIHSNNFSLQNLDNYLKSINPKLRLLCLYNKLITEYLELCKMNININDPTYAKFIVHKGIEMISHIFNTIFLYTKNPDLCDHYCNKASHYYIEFIGQIGEDSHSFLQLNSKDAILFVYKKTIFDINHDYRKNYIITDSDKILLDYIKKESEIVNKLIFYFLGSIKYKNIKSYINECLTYKDNVLKVFCDKKTSQKTYYNIIDNISIWIDIHKNNNISFKKMEESTIALVKKNIKKNINTDTLEKKIKQNDINELYEKLTISKFFTWLL